MRFVRWVRQGVLLAALPLYYYKFRRGDFLLGLLFLQGAPVIPRQLKWCTCDPALPP